MEEDATDELLEEDDDDEELSEEPAEPEDEAEPEVTTPPREVILAEIVDLPLEELEKIVKVQHSYGQKCVFDGWRVGLPYFRSCGLALKVVKQRSSKGYWEEWCRQKLPFTIRTAQYYMRIAENWDKLNQDISTPAGRKMTLREALRELSTESKPRTRIERVDEPNPDMLVENDVRIRDNRQSSSDAEVSGEVVRMEGLRDRVQAELDQQYEDEKARAEMRSDPEKVGEVFQRASRALGEYADGRLVAALVKDYLDENQDVTDNVNTYFDLARRVLMVLRTLEETSDESTVPVSEVEAS